ncbi:MAG: cyanophycinase [Flavobacteriales bacterium]|nr:cyanophycinase [Flavobacteriales bacterium]MCB0816461.1 cyanophycinase [Flavobacteriales bacterium]MCB9181168.1 cyanophycinase [Flavobacteriales bacterium]MCB9199453.1 cyanophycinase [Flavobacteriales bacterium]HOP44128.1 cyanophycinase [Flavobacteriales bacterium]
MVPKGKLIAVGGNEDKGNGEGVDRTVKHDFIEDGILRRVVNEVGGPKARIALITSASSIPDEVAENYVEAFGKLGATNLDHLRVRDRKEVTADLVKRLEQADGVMISGGNQLRLTTIFGGTEFAELLKRRYREEEGFTIAGTSAGAMCMSTTMIYQGHSSSGLFKGEVKMTTGLGLVPNVIIDSHFVARGRFSRLTQAIAANPDAIGVGLGEDTGVVITGGDHLETIGSGQVIIFDGHELQHTNIAEVSEGEALSIEHMVVHIIARGYHYNVAKRTFFAPERVEH